MSSQSPRRAGFWRRSAATAIDYGIIAGLCAATGAVLGEVFRPAGEDEAGWADGLFSDPYLGALAGVVAGFAIVGALYMALEAFTGATIGKMALHLKVVGEDGRPAPSGARVARYLVKNCHLLLGSAASLSGIWFIGALAPLATLVVVAGSTMMLTHERRALHDVIAKTAVVSTVPPGVSS